MTGLCSVILDSPSTSWPLEPLLYRYWPGPYPCEMARTGVSRAALLAVVHRYCHVLGMVSGGFVPRYLAAFVDAANSLPRGIPIEVPCSEGFSSYLRLL